MWKALFIAAALCVSASPLDAARCRALAAAFQARTG